MFLPPMKLIWRAHLPGNRNSGRFRKFTIERTCQCCAHSSGTQAPVWRDNFWRMSAGLGARDERFGCDPWPRTFSPWQSVREVAKSAASSRGNKRRGDAVALAIMSHRCRAARPGSSAVERLCLALPVAARQRAFGWMGIRPSGVFPTSSLTIDSSVRAKPALKVVDGRQSSRRAARSPSAGLTVISRARSGRAPNLSRCGRPVRWPIV